MRMTDLFRREKVLLGMVHLLPLPGSPRWGSSIRAVLEAAREDVKALEAGGMDGCLVENYGDAPFTPGAVDPATVAAMAVVVGELRQATALPLGVNVLKNDARAALAIAAATGARFIRVNIHVGAVVADQGIIQGDAYGTLRYRRLLSADVKLFADVLAKHGAPLAPVDVEQEARDAAYRGLADALIVSGKGTGEPTDLARLEAVRRAVPDRPVLVGSGATPETVRRLLEVADGIIVGTSIKRDGKPANPVDPARVEALVRASGVR
jgi:membrane complex biogenesis BtpA family protein